MFSATASSSAVSGTYSVAVSRLATAQQLVSTAFAGGSSAAIGTGTLKLSLGGTSFNVTVDSSNNSVAGLAATINSASGNPGVTATVVTGSDGAHLVLSSTVTGAANQLQVSETDAGTALSALTYASGNTAHYTQNSAAQDAQFSISGIPYTSPSNTVSNALNGVTLTLTGTTGTSTPTLTVATNSTAIQSNISNFVSAYNTLEKSLSSLGSFDSTTSTAGPMLGDALLSGIKNEVRSALNSVVNTGSPYTSLASIGITTNKDGTLSLNKTTLSTAMSTNFSAVSQIFSGTNGIAASLNTRITADLAKGGSIDSRSTTLVKQDNDLTTKTDQLNTQMTQLSADLTQQYSSLNTLLSSLQTMSAYLTQAFAALPTVQGKSNA
jgi:flagellar hook-associated protein 2